MIPKGKNSDDEKNSKISRGTRLPPAVRAQLPRKLSGGNAVPPRPAIRHDHPVLPTVPHRQDHPELEMEAAAPAKAKLPLSDPLNPNFDPSAPLAEAPLQDPETGELLAPLDEVAPVPDGPPPSDKVDFENLPEFVWQRQMLKRVRIGAVIASAIILAIVLYFVFRAGKETKEVLKPVTDPLPEQK